MRLTHIAERHAGLLPDDAKGRARGWMFAALNTVEPPIRDRETTRLLERDETRAEQREARTAYKRAFDVQLAVFTAASTG